VWTGEEVLIWGGWNRALDRLDSGALYSPDRDRWRAIAVDGAPRGRCRAIGIWADGEFIVWGGVIVSTDVAGTEREEAVNDGARYNVAEERWQRISPSPLSYRRDAVAIWTGSELIVWGGLEFGTDRALADGAAYRPASDSWRMIARAPMVFAGQRAHWSGREMILWAPRGGARYDVCADRWRPIATAAKPAALAWFSSLWANGKFVVWGSAEPRLAGPLLDPAAPFLTASYDAARDRWDMEPRDKSFLEAVWTGSHLLVLVYRND
jgi:hypothetical protein